jgi:hypothetical protein
VLPSRFQFVHYSVFDFHDGILRVDLDALKRFGLWRFNDAMRGIYRWRFVFGPFEIRRWETDPEAKAEALRREAF